MIAPSGKQIIIAAKDQQAVIVEVGGGLRSYSVGGRELLDGYGAEEMSSSGRGQVLIPWPNRLEDGSYEFSGRRYQLPLNEPEHRNAIHGLVRWSTWTATERESHRVLMEHILYPQPGYPFLLGISIEYALSVGGLRVQTTATNLGTQSCPYGSGAHPYLTLGTATIDGLILHVPGQKVLRSDERRLPIRRESVEGTDYDFRQPADREFSGKVTRIADALQTDTRTLLTEIDIPSPDGTLAPGIYCTVELRIPRKSPSISLPADAIIFNGNGMQVAAVNNGKAEIRMVGVKRDLGTRLEVDSGIQAGDQVILNPPVNLVNGSRVRVRTEATAAAGR